MKMFVSENAGFKVIAIEGNLEGGCHTADLEAKLTAALDGKQGVMLDLTKCNWINSSGASILLHWYKKLHGAGLSFAIILGGNATLERMLVITNMSRVIDVYDSLAEAEKYMK